jgi:hypothetical protein
MSRRKVGLFASVVLVLCSALPALAQDTKPVYWRVELWDVKREMWPAFVKSFEKYDQPVYEKLFRDGVITEWGIETATLHNPDEYTHATWHGVSSMEAFEKVESAFDAADKALGEQESARVQREFAGMLVKHRDYLFRVDDTRAKASRLDKAYYSEWSVAIKPGGASDYAGWWKQHIQPVYQKLMDEGVILAYGRFREETRTLPENRRFSWYVTADLAGVDKVGAAFDAVSDALSEENRRERRTSIVDITEPGSFREYTSRYRHWAIKAQ